MADDRSIIAGQFGNELARPGQNIRPLDETKERVNALAATANAWLKDVPEIRDAETAARAQTFIQQINDELKAVNAEEQAEKKPLRDQVTAIGQAYAPIKLVLETVKSLIAPKRDSWLGREKARLAAEKKRQQEDAAKLAREADELARKAMARPTVEGRVAAQNAQVAASKAAEAAASPVERAQVRDLYGGRAASMRVLWRAEIVDPLLCLIYYQEHAEVLEVLQKLANAEAKRAHDERREIPGCHLVEKEIAA